MEPEVHPETPISPVQVDQPSMVSTVIPPVPPAQAQTPVSPIAPTVEYAGFWVRYVAAFIDGLIIGIPTGIITFILVLLLGKLGGGVGRIIGILGGWAYYIYMTNRFGATYGKRALGLEVQAEDGGKLSWGKIAFRETIGKAISAIIFFIGYIMAAFTKRKQALHDKLADSVVVYKNPIRKNNKIIIFIIAIVSFLLALIVAGILFFTIVLAVTNANINKQREMGNQVSLTKNEQGLSQMGELFFFGLYELEIFFNGKDQNLAGHSVITTTTATITDDQQVAITGITTLGHALAYYPTHKSFAGFVDGTSTPIAACSGKPIINISSDGQAIASFGKLCSTPKQYFCVSVDVAHQNVDKGTVVADSYALGGHVTCQ